MDKMLSQLFLYEARLQCKAVLAAETALAGAQTVDDCWIALQNLLVAAANLSKLLWGVNSKAAAQRAVLRASIGVTNASPLHDRNLRNDFEHFDERLEAWFKQSTIYVGRNIGPANMISTGQPSQRFGNFDPATGAVTFWAHTASVPVLVAEVKIILARIEAELAKSVWP
jgi:hypothetical protein